MVARQKGIAYFEFKGPRDGRRSLDRRSRARFAEVEPWRNKLMDRFVREEIDA